MNSTFYMKVEMLEKALINIDENNEINQIKTLINNDIQSLRAFQIEMETYKRQRDITLQNDLKANRKNQINRGYER